MLLCVSACCGLAASQELFSIQSVISEMLSRCWLLTFAAGRVEQPVIKEIIGKH